MDYCLACCSCWQCCIEQRQLQEQKKTNNILLEMHQNNPVAPAPRQAPQPVGYNKIKQGRG